MDNLRVKSEYTPYIEYFFDLVLFDFNIILTPYVFLWINLANISLPHLVNKSDLLI